MQARPTPPGPKRRGLSGRRRENAGFCGPSSAAPGPGCAAGRWSLSVGAAPSSRGSQLSQKASTLFPMADHWKEGDIQSGLTAVRREPACGGEARGWACCPSTAASDETLVGPGRPPPRPDREPPALPLAAAPGWGEQGRGERQVPGRRHSPAGGQGRRKPVLTRMPKTLASWLSTAFCPNVDRQSQKPPKVLGWRRILKRGVRDAPRRTCQGPQGTQGPS